MKKITLFIFLLCFSSATSFAEELRYFHTGNGKIYLKSSATGVAFKGSFRNDDGSYNEAALKKIHDVFGAKYGDPIDGLSLRFIEFLDYIDDKFGDGHLITVASGFRSPRYNDALRSKGRLAAKASLHQYGMAADIRIAGVKSEDIWNYVKELGFGGAGFYHGANVHLDVGPQRFWDEKTTGVDLGLSDDNKLIEVVTDKDIYKPGETVLLRVIRVTKFPVGVNEIVIASPAKRDEAIPWNTGIATSSRHGGTPRDDNLTCHSFPSPSEMTDLKFTIPANTKPGRHQIALTFCGDTPEGMPAQISTPEFEVIK